jgi:hypothetical protein
VGEIVERGPARIVRHTLAVLPRKRLHIFSPTKAYCSVNSFDLLLLDLIQDAETPLYSAYWEFGRELGRPVTFSEFLYLLSPLIAEDAARLWSVDFETHDRSRWFEIPANLEQRYETEELDPRYDPLGLSLTLGPNGDPGATPDWEVDLDFFGGRYRLSALESALPGAQAQLGRLYGDFAFVEYERETTGERVLISGMLARRASRGT